MIEIDHLKKHFGSLVAVDDISFNVVPGEILGFLGPNGAGKSTTMKVITGFLTPTSGRVSVWGCDIETDTLAAQQHIGYLPEGAPCYDEMTTWSFLNFIADVRGFKGAEKSRRVDDVVETMSLEEVIDQRIETLSKGFKRRVGLAQAIIHDPEVLILDEPTDGLDPNQKHHVREMIRGLSKDKIVIISTHILEEVTAVCTRAVIISHGRILSDCKPAELESQSRYHGAITVRVDRVESASALQDKLTSLAGVASVELSADELELTAFKIASDTDLFGPVTELARDASLGIRGIYQEKGRLDEVFRQITQGEPA
ncbi:MAG TPA: ATP-binding cassette domain-containing protein [Pseudomonadales bacterium]|nr:ATP-binding cassette domain-containing protein [Pseudomonadales bacterium]